MPRDLMEEEDGPIAKLGGVPIRSRDDFIVFGQPEIEQDEIDEVVGCLERRWLGSGPLVSRFEDEFGAYKGGGHAVAVNSCTAALHLAVLAVLGGREPGSEVIVPDLTFCATVNAVIHAGGTPVPVDCDPRTLNLTPEGIEAAITPRTAAIVVVHFAGRACEMDPIREIASRHGLAVIEDCAHAIETEYHGRKAGTIGDVGCFSFYVTKNVVTGEGGMILTSDAELAAEAKILALHGMSQDAWKRFSDAGYKHYQVVGAGFKYNMMDLQAAIGIHQLRRVEVAWKRRREVWNRYQEAFADLPCDLPLEPAPGTRHGYHLYTPLLRTDELRVSRDWVLEALTEEGIGVGVHYVPLHLHPFYQSEYGWRSGQFPVAQQVGARTLSLPLSPALGPRDVDDVIRAFRRVLAAAR